MLQALEIDCHQEQLRITTFIRRVLDDAGFDRLVVGLSGGIDSALTAALAAQVVGAANVRAMIMPYRTSNPDSEAHARLLADKFGIPCCKCEITGMVDALVLAYPDMSDRRKGNVMARSRMTVLFDQSMAFGGLVAGTSNRTELLLGYFTIYGDGAASLEPIGHLFKCQVRALARHLGVPTEIIDKAPSADLWAGQTDEGDLGYSYDTADQVLYLATQRGLGAGEIAGQGFDCAVVDAILRRVESTAYKRSLPPMLEP